MSIQVKMYRSSIKFFFLALLECGAEEGGLFHYSLLGPRIYGYATA